MRIATAIRSLVLAAAVSIIPAASYAGVFVSIGIGAPPVLPVYAQPSCPAPGYIWTPGYWAYDDEAGYYWVPGAWVLAPYSGALWTPGYWGWGDGGYFWHAGYWGPHVGFYGGVNYGFGYFGRGFEGGYWDTTASVTTPQSCTWTTIASATTPTNAELMFATTTESASTAAAAASRCVPTAMRSAGLASSTQHRWQHSTRTRCAPARTVPSSRM